MVTGASSGVGREIALHLSRSRRLVLNGRDHSRLAETRALCQRPEEHLLWPLDLQEGDSIEASLGELIERNQVAIEAFVHSAGTLKIVFALISTTRVSPVGDSITITPIPLSPKYNSGRSIAA